MKRSLAARIDTLERKGQPGHSTLYAVVEAADGTPGDIVDQFARANVPPDQLALSERYGNSLFVIMLRRFGEVSGMKFVRWHWA
jgi:hypothetical protein